MQKQTVVFYSYSGNTKKAATEFANENNLQTTEIKTPKRHGKFYTFMVGCPKAIRGGKFKIMPLQPYIQELQDATTVHVFSPVWAGCLNPAVNAFLEELPKDKQIFVHAVSAGGESAKVTVSERIEKLGLSVAGYEEIKS
jgi:flavodoxin